MNTLKRLWRWIRPRDLFVLHKKSSSRLKVKDILKDETCWCQDYYALDDNGLVKTFTDPEATRFCLLGAMYKVNIPDSDRVKIEDRLKKLGFEDVVNFNDNSSFDEVRKLIEDLDV